jgi:hypothetical protein
MGDLKESDCSPLHLVPEMRTRFQLFVDFPLLDQFLPSAL